MCVVRKKRRTPEAKVVAADAQPRVKICLKVSGGARGERNGSRPQRLKTTRDLCVTDLWVKCARRVASFFLLALLENSPHKSPRNKQKNATRNTPERRRLRNNQQMFYFHFYFSYDRYKMVIESIKN